MRADSEPVAAKALREWCATLLGVDDRPSAGGALLMKSIAAMRLDGKELVQQVVLPALGASMAAKQLHAEIEASCSGLARGERGTEAVF